MTETDIYDAIRLQREKELDELNKRSKLLLKEEPTALIKPIWERLAALKNEDIIVLLRTSKVHIFRSEFFENLDWWSDYRGFPSIRVYKNSDKLFDPTFFELKFIMKTNSVHLQHMSFYTFFGHTLKYPDLDVIEAEKIYRLLDLSPPNSSINKNLLSKNLILWRKHKIM